MIVGEGGSIKRKTGKEIRVVEIEIESLRRKIKRKTENVIDQGLDLKTEPKVIDLRRVEVDLAPVLFIKFI